MYNVIFCLTNWMYKALCDWPDKVDGLLNYVSASAFRVMSHVTLAHISGRGKYAIDPDLEKSSFCKGFKCYEFVSNSNIAEIKH